MSCSLIFFIMSTLCKWDVSVLSSSIHIVSVKCSMVYLGRLSSLYFYMNVLWCLSFFLFLYFIYYYFWLLSFFICFISYIYFSIFHKMSHGIFLSKTILLFDKILYKIFKINVTICNVFMCAWARIIYLCATKEACMHLYAC
jgi:hypothetical protein